MASFTIDINTSDLTTRLSPDKLSQAKAKGLEYSSQELIRVLMRNSPVDHGLLKSWFVESMTSDEVVIKSPAEYAQWVNDGTMTLINHGLLDCFASVPVSVPDCYTPNPSA